MAKTILDQLGPIYTAHADAALTVSEGAIDVSSTGHSSTPSADPVKFPQKNSGQITPRNAQATQIAEPRYFAEQIATTLSNHAEQARIKKLAFAVAKGYWENSVTAIDGLGLTNIILELHQRYPTQPDLKNGFGQIVNNINKATLYMAITRLIIKQMSCLYESLDDALTADTPESNAALPTQIMRGRDPVKALAKQQGQDHMQTSILDVQSMPVMPVPPPPPPQPRQTDPIVTVLGAAVPPPTPIQVNSPPQYNLFDLRSEIMQNTNPLRAKILLFSVLFQSWDEHGQDWGMIRSYGLDDLVEQLLLSRKPPNDVEIKLNAQAEQMEEVEAYQQTAQTLIKILKPRLH